MPTWLKVVLGVVGFMIVSCGLVVGAGVWWFKKNRTELESMAPAARAAGEAFAQEHDQAGCLKKSLEVLGQKGGLFDEVKNKFFLSACLENAAPTLGFCDGVPPSSEFIRTATWATVECGKHAPGEEQPCSRLVQEVQKFCENAH